MPAFASRSVERDRWGPACRGSSGVPGARDPGGVRGECDVGKATPGGGVGRVRHPEQVGPRSREVALHRVRRPGRGLPDQRFAHALSASHDTTEADPAHPPLHRALRGPESLPSPCSGASGKLGRFGRAARAAKIRGIVSVLELLQERGGEAVALHERYLNAPMVRMLRTIGFDVQYTRASGPYLYDEAGERYLDLLSGWGVFALGRNHPHVVAQLRDVLGAELPQLVQLEVAPLAGLLAERLLERIPYLEKVFFCNSGTEAVEAAIKFSRCATGRSKILYAEGAFHGLSYGSLSLNDDEHFRSGFGPLLPDCESVPFDDAEALERALRGRDVAAFFVEPIQGHGVRVPGPDYLPAAARLCARHGTLLVADEIQTGLGRTGRFCAVEHWGVEPDMVLLAKALSGGFVPVGAVALRRSIFDRVFDRMDRAVVHGSTFAKNNLAMAAGLATLDVLDTEGLIPRAARLGEELLEKLSALVPRFECLREVRGKGLMIGLRFGEPESRTLKAAWKLLEKANPGLFCQLIVIPLFARHRILSQVAGHAIPVVKFLPPLVLSDEDAERTISAVEEVVADAHRVPGAIWDLGRNLARHALRRR